MGLRAGARVARDRPDRRALRPLRRRRVAGAARDVHDDRAGERGAARRGRAGDAGGGCTARSRPRARRSRTAGPRCPGSERAKYLFRIARILQERSREFAVLESLNGGKPIKESRDVDLPFAAAHFFYYAGWADKLEYAFPNRRPRPLGVAGQIIPWNFPLLMLAWKIAPALAAGNTVVLKPAETTPLTALLFCDVVRQAELPAGVVNIVTGDGRTGAALVEGDVDKIAFTGSTEVGKAIQRELAGSGKRLTLELGGKAANIVFDDCALDQAVEGIVNGIYFNQGHVCCAGSRLLVQESIHDDVVEKLKRRMETLRVGDPLDKNTDIGAINSRAQLEKIQELVARGRGGGRRDLPAAVPAARARATGSRRPCSRTWRRATGSRRRRSSGPCSRCSRSGRPTRRSRRRTTRRTGSAPASGPRRARASSGWRSGFAPASSGRTRTTASTRRRRSAATRSPGSAARAAGTGSSRTWSSYAATIGHAGALPVTGRGDATRALQSGRRVSRASESTSAAPSRVRVATTAEGQNVARASRKDLRDAVRAARAALPGWAGATAYNRGQVLYRIAEMMEARRADLAAALLRRGRGRPLDRPPGLVRGLGRQARAGARRDEPRRRPVLQLHDPGADRRRRHPRARTSRRSRPRLAPRARDRRRQRGRRRRLRAAPARRVELAEVLATSDLPGGVVNILTGHREELAPWLAGHMDVNAIDITGADGHAPELEQARRRERQARRPRRARRAEPLGDRRLPRAEDRLAPDRPTVAQ